MKYVILAVCSLCWLAGTTAARAGDLTHEEMVCALMPECTSPFVDRRLRGRGVNSAASERPALSFDTTVNFAFDSVDLTPEARASLDAVGRALTDTRTGGYDIVISGHTDARGTAEYNQALSERRAEAVRSYLISHHRIDPSRLVARGYGKTQLLLPAQPSHDLNRRVQFQNPNVAQAPSQVAPASTESRSAVAPASATVSAPQDGRVPQGDGL